MGVLALVVQVAVFGRWIGDGGLRSAQRNDLPVSASREILILLGQAGVALVVLVSILVVARQCRYERTVSFDAALLVGWGAAVWLGPAFNYRHVNGVFNLHAVNISSWGPYLPGWDPPRPDLATEAVLAGAMIAYLAMNLWMWGQRWCLRPLRDRIASWSRPRILLVLIAAGALVDLILELLFVGVFGAYAFIGANWRLSLFGGHWYQLPVTTLLLDGILLSTPMTLMLYQAARQGTTVHIFQGEETFTAPKRRWLRLLAGIGFVNILWATYLALTNLVPVAVGSDPVPTDTPAYFWPR
ncbi:spirocyclase AveC family protein [Streptomyces syringium]|uniref:spirocyclase AveC family protein n=1 Tax=Streptomyces syringium TaxID=76729 RepID=UPI0034561496